MGGRCRRRGNATRHTDFVHGFRSIRRGVARRSSWMGVDECHKPDPKLASEGDGDDGRGTTWRCGTRAVGNCRRMIAPGGRRAPMLIPTAIIVPRVAYRRVRRLLGASSYSATLAHAISGLEDWPSPSILSKYFIQVFLNSCIWFLELFERVATAPLPSS